MANIAQAMHAVTANVCLTGASFRLHPVHPRLDMPVTVCPAATQIVLSMVLTGKQQCCFRTKCHQIPLKGLPQMSGPKRNVSFD